MDITTDNRVPPDQQSQGVMLAKEDGVIAGLEVFGHLLSWTQGLVGSLIQDGNHILASIWRVSVDLPGLCLR